MSTPDQINTAFRRMQLLRTLSLHAGLTALPSSLQKEMADVGYPSTLTKIMMDTVFLAELGLVDSSKTGTVSLTAEGLDVVSGLLKFPGLE